MDRRAAASGPPPLPLIGTSGMPAGVDQDNIGVLLSGERPCCKRAALRLFCARISPASPRPARPRRQTMLRVGIEHGDTLFHAAIPPRDSRRSDFPLRFPSSTAMMAIDSNIVQFRGGRYYDYVLAPWRTFSYVTCCRRVPLAHTEIHISE